MAGQDHNSGKFTGDNCKSMQTIMTADTDLRSSSGITGRNNQEAEFPPPTIHALAEPQAREHPEPYYTNYEPGVPIAVDFGTSQMRVGLTNYEKPFLTYPSIISKFRDRKLNRTLAYVGNDCYLDSSFKSTIKTPFDGPLITNWDYVEWMLDYSFSHLGVNSSNGVDNPIIVNEILATPVSQRNHMYQLLFEAYNIPKLTFGIDDLFSFYYNGGKSGLIVGAGNQTTNVIPVIDTKPLLNHAKRINWGGEQAVDYLSKSINLKYPFFPSKISQQQVESMIKEFCYVSNDYAAELDNLMDLNYLHDKDIIVEASFNEIIQPQKTEEEIQKQHEKRIQQGKRLQEQAQKARLEKLVEKEADFNYYSDIKERLFNPENKVSKKTILQTLQGAGFDDIQDFNKYLGSLERSLKRARNQDIGENEEDEEPNFHLLSIKDEDLTEEQLKEKKGQKLQKANYDARKKAKEEKLIEKQKKEEEQRKEKEWREKDLQGWLESKRSQLKIIVDRKRQRKKMKDELNDRKSHAAQVRMKNIANLAAEGGGDDKGGRNSSRNASFTSLNNLNNGGSGGGRNKRNQKKVTIDNDPNDTFGANDDDWAIYRDISKFEDEDALEIEDNELRQLEEMLLEYDPDFNPEDLFNSEFNWKKSTVHKFLRGAYPFDPENQHHQHQIHLNVERIKIPEALIQPSIVGLDQAGIVEISENLILRRLPGEGFYKNEEESLKNNKIIGDVFLTGGLANYRNFSSRIVKEFTSFLPVGSNLNVRKASDPLLDPWRGMRKWSTSDNCKNSYVTRKEYDEMGPDYIKEHNLGNVQF